MLQNADDVARLVVATYNHKPVYLKQIATIIDGPGEIEHITKIGFGAAYTGKRSNDYEIPGLGGDIY